MLGAGGIQDTGRTMPATEISDAEVREVRLGRLARLRAEMGARDIGSVVLVDPVNIRYATDSRNMQIFTARNPARYLFVPLEGPVVLFEFAGCTHLAEGLETIDEVRVAKTASFVAAAQRLGEVTGRWADEIDELIRAHGGDNRRVGLERFNAAAAFALHGRGYEIVDAQEPVERARAVKVPGEVAMMRASMEAVESAVADLQAALRPGITENELWAVLWRRVIEDGGDYVETRLLSSGPRTNPWFQEAGERVIEAGDMVGLDTDVVGRYGYYADFSRSWICGDESPSARQRTLYRLAYEQIQHNVALVRPGVGFREMSERGWRIPERYEDRRYYLLAHGIGMTGEYPYVLYAKDYADGGYEGVIEPNMMLCIESFIGNKDGGEGVKLEQQVLVTETGCELVSTYPFDDRLLGTEF